MRHLNILQVTAGYPPNYAFGGPTVSAGEIARGLQKLGHQLITITSNRNGDGFAMVTEHNQEPEGNIAIYCRTSPGRFYYAQKLSTIIQQHLPQANIVLVPSGWNYYFFTACRLARQFRRPYVLKPEGNFSPYALAHKPVRKKIWWSLFDNKSFQEAAVILALTQEEVNQIKSMGINTRIEIIPNGVNIHEFQQAFSRKEIECQFPQLKDRNWLLFMSRFHPIKGFDLLLPAFARVYQYNRNVILILAGPNESNYERVVKDFVKDLGLQEAVCFTGMVSGAMKNGLLHHSDLFCLTSHSEGMPVGVLEAMACGLPVVITKECHLPEVKEWQAGLVVNRDVNEIGAARGLLLEDEQARQEMKSNCRRLVHQRFTWEKVCNMTSQLFQEITSK